MTNEGVEFDLSYKWNINKFRFSVDANASYLKNHVDNLENANGILYLQTLGTQGYVSVDENGQPANSFYGLIADGIFQNQAQINAYVNSKGQLIQPNAQPGDVKFKDINGDGVIDSNDRTIIGNQGWSKDQ
jgi:hypothetical protein